jgi:insulysin
LVRWQKKENAGPAFLHKLEKERTCDLREEDAEPLLAHKASLFPVDTYPGSANMTSREAAASSIFGASGVVVEKPETHKRDYRYLLLDNGMQAVIAHDPKCDKASAAMAVDVGKLLEPKELAGLAHFCEHMLFLGTTKYPEEGEYKQFIKLHGGRNNASTSDTYTCYQFDVAPDGFAGTLDRFAQFFISPLFTPSATEREINAIESEHSMRITNDFRRQLALLLVDANPAHPLHWGSGNLATLRDEPKAKGLDLHAELLKFYKAKYSANVMGLCVVGKESLDELETMVRDKFSPIPNQSLEVVLGESCGGEDTLPFTDEQFVTHVLYSPSKDLRELTFMWRLPWQTPQWRTKPASYVSHLLGHEGGGSLLSQLKQEGLATGLTCGTQSFLGCVSTFEVEITLTQKALEDLQCKEGDAGLQGQGAHIQRIGELLFKYVRLLQQTGPLQWAFDETKRIKEQQFRFANDVQPYSLTQRIAKALHRYPADHALSHNKLYDFDAAQISAVLDQLTVPNLRLMLCAKMVAPLCKSTDPWYGGSFEKFNIGSASLFDGWRQVWGGAATGDAAGDADVGPVGLRLPPPNPFLAEDLSIKQLPGVAGEKRLDGGGVPTPVLDTKFAKLWHKQDTTFKQPKALVNVYIKSPWVAESVEHRVLADLWCGVVMEELNEFSYDASLAGLDYALYQGKTGVLLSVGGFNDKLPALVAAVGRKMCEVCMGAGEEGTLSRSLGIVFERTRRSLTNAAYKAKPSTHAQRMMNDLLNEKSDTYAKELQVLLEIAGADVSVIAGASTGAAAAAAAAAATVDLGLVHAALAGVNEKILSDCYLEGLAMGNLTADEASGMLQGLVDVLGMQRKLTELPMPSEAALPTGVTKWSVEGPDEEDGNNCVRWVIQIPYSLSVRPMVWLLQQIGGAKFFADIRTKQQLGYITTLTWKEGDGFLYMLCYCQTEYCTDYVQGRVNRFMRGFWAELLAMTDEEDEREGGKKGSEQAGETKKPGFATYVQAVISQLEEKPKNLREEFGRYWSEIVDRRYAFDRRQQQVERLQQLTLAEFQQWVRDELMSAPQLHIHVRSPKPAKPMDATPEEKPDDGDDADDTAKYDRAWAGMDEPLSTFRESASWTRLDGRLD